MISILCLQSPSDRKNLLKDFNPSKETWLVSDMKSKTYLQNELLNIHPILPEESILRASELWRKLFKKVKPKFHIVSEELAVLLIGDWLRERGDWCKTPGAARAAYAHLSYLMPIFAHGSGIEGMRTWFQANPGAQDRWGHWFVECFFLWNKFEEYQLAAPGWLSAHLMNVNFKENWSRPIWVDLGLRMLTVETEILANLSQQTAVRLIQPDTHWMDEYKSSMGAYDFLEVLGETKKVKIPSASEDKKNKVVCRKFSSPLGEVKDAVATIREWLTLKVPLENIACVAPHMKEYETVLRLMCAKEKFPISDSEKADLATFPDVHSWICELSVSLGQFDSGQLESALYANEKTVLSFDEFNRIYKIIYDSDDLQRAERVFQEYQSKPSLKKSRLKCRDFAEWSITRWKGGDVNRLIKIIDKFLSEAPEDIELESLSWLEHLSTIAIRNDEKLDHLSSGIQFADLHSSENLQATHIVVLGLSEDALRKSRRLGILPKDLWSIQSELGFNLPLIEDVNSEFDAQWLLESKDKQFHLYCSESNWEGRATSPSLLWHKFSGVQHRELSIPGPIAWDNRGKIELQQAVARDFEGKSQLKSRIPDKLSISSVEDYLSCPFVYAAKKLFRCDDSEYVDLEVGAQSGGRLKHRLMEKILEGPLDWDQQKLEELLENIAVDLEIPRISKEIWASQRKRFVTLGLRFQAFEQEWRKQFPETKTIARELAFEIYFDPVGLTISAQPPGVWIRGSIDRIDEDSQGRVVVIDYKSSSAHLTNWSSWIDKRSLQLGFYADVVASGMTALGKREVIGAFYMNLKDFERDRGLARNDVGNSLFEIGRKKFGLTEDEQVNVFKDIRELTAKTVLQMQTNSFDPLPFDQKDCAVCKWNQLCRGSHLL